MSKWIDADVLKESCYKKMNELMESTSEHLSAEALSLLCGFTLIDDAPSIDIVRCKECSKSHIDGKTTHYLWCTEWGRSTDTFGYCERGEREGE